CLYRCPPRRKLFPYTTLFRSQVARAVHQVALDEVAHLRSERRPVLVAVIGHHEDGHHFTTRRSARGSASDCCCGSSTGLGGRRRDRKSTRLNSSHVKISYAVF